MYNSSTPLALHTLNPQRLSEVPDHRILLQAEGLGLASVFSCGKYCGAILHRGPKGYEAIGEDNASHGCFPSQREAAAALQQMAVHSS